MAMGKRKDHQGDLFISPDDLPVSQGHTFYEKLNQLLSKHQFDQQIEELCQQYYDDGEGERVAEL